MKRSYPTDLTEAEWRCLEPHVPAPEERGRPKTHTTREILDAVFYVLKSGCPWRLLPRDFPPWQTVYWWFGRWRADGTPSSGSPPRCASDCGSAWAGICYPARASPTPSRPRLPGSGASREDTTGGRRFEVGSATCSWTPRVCSSKPGSTARRCPTRTG